MVLAEHHPTIAAIFPHKSSLHAVTKVGWVLGGANETKSNGISNFNSSSAQQHTPAALSRQSKVALAAFVRFVTGWVGRVDSSTGASYDFFKEKPMVQFAGRLFADLHPNGTVLIIFMTSRLTPERAAALRVELERNQVSCVRTSIANVAAGKFRPAKP
jgi:hypothetical protein